MLLPPPFPFPLILLLLTPTTPVLPSLLRPVYVLIVPVPQLRIQPIQLRELSRRHGDGPFAWRDVVALLRARPDLVALNAHVEQKEVVA